MLQFTIQEKKAIMSLLYDMAGVDGKVSSRESQLLDLLKVKWNLSLSDVLQAKKMTPPIVASTIRNMNESKRLFASQLLASMQIIDEDVSYSEELLYDMLVTSCNLPHNFVYRAALLALDKFLTE